MSEDGRFEHSAEFRKDILLVHTLTVPTYNDILFGMKAISASQLLDRYPDYKYIFTGDNHTAFIHEEDGRYVVNPGCLNIQTADKMDTIPCVYYVDTVKEKIKRIDLTSFHEYISNGHLIAQHTRDERISSFVETIKKGEKVNLNFDDNLDNAFAPTSPDVMAIYDELKQEVCI